jgi:hypothetical protein
MKPQQVFSDANHLLPANSEPIPLTSRSPLKQFPKALALIAMGFGAFASQNLIFPRFSDLEVLGALAALVVGSSFLLAGLVCLFRLTWLSALIGVGIIVAVTICAIVNLLLYSHIH